MTLSFIMRVTLQYFYFYGIIYLVFYMKYFINGEIYLKKGPSIFNSTITLSDVYERIDDLNFELSKENPDFSLARDLKAYENLKDQFEAVDGKLDYSYTEDFWQAYKERNGILLKCSYSNSVERVYKDIEQLESDFVKLSDFLDKATFVGRKFRRTKPVIHHTGKGDKSYMFVDDKYYYIVLYAMQDLFLVMKHSYNGDEYLLINSQYTLDGNYEFYGEVFQEYADKDMVYREILEQIENKNRKL